MFENTCGRVPFLVKMQVDDRKWYLETFTCTPSFQLGGRGWGVEGVKISEISLLGGKRGVVRNLYFGVGGCYWGGGGHVILK